MGRKVTGKFPKTALLVLCGGMLRPWVPFKVLLSRNLAGTLGRCLVVALKPRRQKREDCRRNKRPIAPCKLSKRHSDLGLSAPHSGKGLSVPRKGRLGSGTGNQKVAGHFPKSPTCVGSGGLRTGVHLKVLPSTNLAGPPKQVPVVALEPRRQKFAISQRTI